MHRKRKAIPLSEQLAAALACLLPQDQRDDLRRSRAPAKAILKLFTMHHLDFWTFSQNDSWWNLDPLRRDVHKARFPIDAAAIAKVKRLQRGPRRPKKKIAQRRNSWPPKGSRPLNHRKGESPWAS